MKGVNEDIVRKIKRCMDLSSSSNENEAALAIKQMKSLMAKHNLTESHALAFDVCEASTGLDVKKNIPQWVLILHSAIGQAMDCESMVERGGYSNAKITYVGVGAAPEIANYAFEVLYRQLKKQREQFIKTRLSRFKPQNKTKHADAFCLGWGLGVGGKVRNLNPNQEIKEKIKAHYEVNHPQVKGEYMGLDRLDKRKSVTHDFMNQGMEAAADVQLHAATGNKSQVLIEG